MVLDYENEEDDWKTRPSNSNTPYLQWVELAAELTDGLHILLVALPHLKQFDSLHNWLELFHHSKPHHPMCATPFLQLAYVVPAWEGEVGEGGEGSHQCCTSNL